MSKKRAFTFNLFTLCILLGLNLGNSVPSEEQGTIEKLLSPSIEGPSQSNPSVVLQNGLTVVGHTNSTVDQNKEYFSFRGIPYAEPPVGDLRFRPPVPLLGPFNNSKIIYAFEDGSPCVQSNMDGTGAIGSEDCLFINVYSPQLTNDKDKLLPVMVWIHGGGFFGDHGGYSNYGPDYFLNEDVVVVTFNYRLGIFGFLSTEDLASPGNYGLKDQILALKWVNSNINRFGGNPNAVTLFGQSAGAASVSYLTQAPKTEDLFHKAILESGTSLNIWGLVRDPILPARSTALLLHISATNSHDLVEALRKTSYDKLQEASTTAAFKVISESSSRGGFPFGPVMEPPHPGAVIVNRSYEQVNSGLYHRIPYIIGFNSLESVNLLDNPLKEIKLYSTTPRSNPLTIVPESMNLEGILKKIAPYTAIHAYYFGLKPIKYSDQDLIKYNSDDLMVRSIVEYASIHAKTGPVYVYRFSYKGILGSGNRVGYGVGHGEELPYFWRINYDTSTPNPSDLETRHRVIKLWTSFAKHGKPTAGEILWKTSDSAGKESVSYLDIGKELIQQVNPEAESLNNWKRWFRQFGLPPYYTY